MSDLFLNFPLIAALLGVFSAQFLKIPIHYFQTRQIKWGLFISTGGMPSSHSASVTSLATAVGALHGVGSTLFAIATMFAIIVMYDAKGIRWHAGEQAAVLNDLVEEFRDHVKETNKQFEQKDVEEQRKELKELLGHSPKEVFFGGLLGILQTLILSWLFL
ncbi:divergent PAP2 family protein [Fictibacillus phosphorivorans]|uniref:divergent PAP2 family protein n=1 Tax=Fictibacillus phosphorivorans TaxID=1221500 RepID=UPI00204141E0|nr:divergent PAP2 family protein [Fictibacillus phosphorivorans]MCM3718752.1 divergent PAP2 family protein [Fictibacillus phosphorivorans]MCM3776375.1 divergent PAP2 family protein [Fictibacillus phosphorivorans]